MRNYHAVSSISCTPENLALESPNFYAVMLIYCFDSTCWSHLDPAVRTHSNRQKCSPSFWSVCPIATRYPKMHWYVQKPLRDLRASAHVWTILNPHRLVWHGLTKCWAVLTFLKVVATEIMAIVMGKAFSYFSGPLRHYIFVGKQGSIVADFGCTFSQAKRHSGTTVRIKCTGGWACYEPHLCRNRIDIMHVLLGKRSCNGTVAKSKTHLLLIGPQRAARWPSSNIGSPILFWHSHASKWSYSRSWNRCKTKKKKDGLTGMPLLMFLTSWGSGIVLIALVSGIVLIALGLGIRNRSHDIHRSQAHWCTGSFSPHCCWNRTQHVSRFVWNNCCELFSAKIWRVGKKMRMGKVAT